MQVIDLGHGSVAHWSAVDEETNIPYIALAGGNLEEFPDFFPNHTVMIRYHNAEVLQFHIDRLTEFRDYLLECDQYERDLAAYNEYKTQIAEGTKDGEV